MRFLWLGVLFFIFSLRAAAAPETECQQSELVKVVTDVVKQPSRYAALLERAQAGEQFSQVVVGMTHLWTSGLGEKTNRDEGVRWLESAATQGSVFSMRFLTTFFENEALSSKGATQLELERRSAYWSQRGVELGDADSERVLGDKYWRGKGIEQNKPEALRLWLRAAEKGSRLAQWSLFAAFSEGQGITPDFKSAVLWGTLASRRVNGVGLMNPSREKQLADAQTQLSDLELTAVHQHVNEISRRINAIEIAKATSNEKECGVREFNKGWIN